jgi:NADH-quinone oxidoreductase subunit D
VEIGYLHRAFEKDCEVGPYNNAHPLHGPAQLRLAADQQLRLRSAIEKLLGIDITDRCKYIRVIMSEISRVCDHLTCVGAGSMELGAFTVFLYMIKAREYLWELVEDVTGARLTISYGPRGRGEGRSARRLRLKVKKAFGEVRQVLEEVHTLVTANRIFMDRMVGVGALSGRSRWPGASPGPLLRAAGVNYDLRKAQPYWAYGTIPFEVPLGKNGDNFDRYLVRMGEMEQSMRIAEQALEVCPAAPSRWTGRQGHRPRRLRGPRQAGEDGGAAAGAHPALAEPAGAGARRHERVNTRDKQVVLPPKETPTAPSRA